MKERGMGDYPPFLALNGYGILDSFSISKPEP